MQYAQELKEYQQTEAYHITSAKIHDKKIKKGKADLLYMKSSNVDLCHGEKKHLQF